jgi:L-arabinose isomerase
VPVIILNLQPAAAIDYATFNRDGRPHEDDRRVAGHCAACPVPEIANVFNDARRALPPGHRGCSTTIRSAGAEVDAWVEAARVAAGMANNRLGLMGHYYNGMLDIYSDVTLQCARSARTSNCWRSMNSRPAAAR